MKYQEIKNLEDLRSSMCISNDESEENIAKLFHDIAHFIINHCSIKCLDTYSNKERTINYRITDIEFYYFNDNHRDIFTHPRNSESLMWYINDFGGIDLNFQSKIDKNLTTDMKDNKVSYKYKLEKKSYFGGILIRQVESIKKKRLGGPWKVADLFRKLDATSSNQNNPILECNKVYEPTEIFELQRHNILGSKKKAIDKAEYNIKENYNGNYIASEDLEAIAEHFKTAKYRFTIYPNGKR